jgi:outer membrane immunogenic protein
VRGRLGYAFNNVLIYGTGGFAYGGVEDDYNIIAPNQRRSFNNSSSVQTGFAAGGGIAWAIPRTAFIVKAEYLRYDLGNRDMFIIAPNNLFVTADNPNGTGRTFNSKIEVTANVFRVGLDYKF